jgi:hypothetical protein
MADNKQDDKHNGFRDVIPYMCKCGEFFASPLYYELHMIQSACGDKFRTVKKRNGYMYFIRSGDTNRFKIGITKRHPKKRMVNLQTGNPELLTLHRYIKCGDSRAYEAYLHECFKEKNIRGEWYNMTEGEIDDLIDFITSA